MELKNKTDICIIGKMISPPSNTDGIIADACWKTPTVHFLWSVKSFKYFFKRWWGLTDHRKSCSWSVSNTENNYALGPSFKKTKVAWL